MADIDWLRPPRRRHRRTRRCEAGTRRAFEGRSRPLATALGRWWPLLAELCTDPAFAAAAMFRAGPAAATFIHQPAGGTAELAAATFVRSGPAAAQFYRDRCD